MLVLFAEQRLGAPAAVAPWLPPAPAQAPDQAIAEKAAASAMRGAQFGTSEGHAAALREGAALGAITGGLTPAQARLLARDTAAHVILVGQVSVSALRRSEASGKLECSVDAKGAAYAPDGALLTAGEAHERVLGAASNGACEQDGLASGGAALAFDLLERVTVLALAGTKAPPFSGRSASGRETLSLERALQTPPSSAPLLLTFVGNGGKQCPESLSRLVALSRRSGARLLPIVAGGLQAARVSSACGLSPAEVFDDTAGTVAALYGARIAEPVAAAPPGWFHVPTSPGVEVTFVLAPDGVVVSAHLERGEALERAVEKVLAILGATSARAGR